MNIFELTRILNEMDENKTRVELAGNNLKKTVDAFVTDFKTNPKSDEKLAVYNLRKARQFISNADEWSEDNFKKSIGVDDTNNQLVDQLFRKQHILYSTNTIHKFKTFKSIIEILQDNKVPIEFIKEFVNTVKQNEKIIIDDGKVISFEEVNQYLTSQIVSDLYKIKTPDISKGAGEFLMKLVIFSLTGELPVHNEGAGDISFNGKDYEIKSVGGRLDSKDEQLESDFIEIMKSWIAQGFSLNGQKTKRVTGAGGKNYNDSFNPIQFLSKWFKRNGNLNLIVVSKKGFLIINKDNLESAANHIYIQVPEWMEKAAKGQAYSKNIGLDRTIKISLI